MERFYPIASSAQRVHLLAAAGARLIQIRIKGLTEPALSAEIRQAAASCQRYGAELVVNDYWDIALHLGVTSVHLGQSDLDHADLAALRQRQVRLGISTHSQAELDRALSLGPSYVALGPIWPTTTKVMTCPPQGVDRIRQWRAQIGNLPLVAIGGVTLDRAPACLQAGASAVAVVRDVNDHADPGARVQQWFAQLETVA